MSKVLHTQAIRQIFGAAVDGDSASIAYQADQLAVRLDDARDDLLRTARRAEQQAHDLVTDHGAASAELLAQTAAECVQLRARVVALETGLFALVQAAGMGKAYVEAKRAK